MQKLINVMAVLGFTVSGLTVVGATYAYANRETFVQQLVEALCMQLEPLLEESIKKTLPEQTILPEITGPAVRI